MEKGNDKRQESVASHIDTICNHKKEGTYPRIEGICAVTEPAHVGGVLCMMQ